MTTVRLVVETKKGAFERIVGSRFIAHAWAAFGKRRRCLVVLF